MRRPARQSAAEAPPLHNPLSLRTAIKFAVLYSAIAFLVTIVSKNGWTQSFLPLAFVSGLTDMDAITLSIARDQGGQIEMIQLATTAVVLAGVANTILKAGLAISLGSQGLRWRIAIVLGATAAIGIGWMFVGPLFPIEAGA